jgi:hypothetical protein
MFCICLIRERNLEYTEIVHDLLIDLKKGSVSERREVFNIIIESGIPIKLVRLIKLCLNETVKSV